MAGGVHNTKTAGICMRGENSEEVFESAKLLTADMCEQDEGQSTV